jgi:hypothetical protein
MEHTVLPRELMAYAMRNQRALHMVQTDFSNAFGSVPHGLIRHNMLAMGLPETQVEIVMSIYRDAQTAITVPTGPSAPIIWRSGTVQESSERGFPVYIPNRDEPICTNVAAYADGLILFAE